MRIPIPLLALAATTTLLAPAMAQNMPTGDGTAVVSYADLDLASPADVRELDRRLRAAVEDVCGPISSADPAGKRAVRHCRTALRTQIASRRADVLAGVTRTAPIVVAMQR